MTGADRSAGTRLERLVARLHAFYGALPSPPRDPFTVFVWEVLGIQTTPHKRDTALAALKRLRALTPDAMGRAPQAKLQAAVALAGPYVEQRLHTLRLGLNVFRRAPDLPNVIRGPIAPARRALDRLPQLGEAGAQRMLLFAADRRLLPADAGVTRVAARLGYAGAPPRIRRALAAELPASADALRDAYLYLAHHAAATCVERAPHCHVCPVLDDCPEGQLRLGNAGEKKGT